MLVDAVKSYLPQALPAWREVEVGVQIVTKYDEHSKVRNNVTVSLDNEALSVTLLQNTSVGDKRQVWRWHADADRTSEARTLREILGNVDQI